MIIWKDTIAIITKLYEVKEKEIAEYLEISPTFLSHVKNGRRSQSDCFIPSRVYRKIFDPANKQSMVSHSPIYADVSSSKVEKTCLADLKKIIGHNFPNVQSNISDCWGSEDYKEFVLELLNRTRMGTLLKEKMPASTDSDEITATHDVDDGELNAGPVEESRVVGGPELGKIRSNVAGCTNASGVAGAQLHIEDKYKCCRFCVRWMGDIGDEVAICKTFKDQREAIDGRNCKYYKPNEGRMTVDSIRCHRTLKN